MSSQHQAQPTQHVLIHVRSLPILSNTFSYNSKPPFFLVFAFLLRYSTQHQAVIFSGHLPSSSARQGRSSNHSPNHSSNIRALPHTHCSNHHTTMKAFAIPTALLVACLISGSQAAFKLKLEKTSHPTTLSKRHILPRQNVYLELLNNVTGGSYAAQISVGTPPQKQNLAIDTGSSDVWFMESTALRCTDPYMIAYFGGCPSVCE